ncbi:MAG: T9SS type B sorting domain-containing protein [Bacteroidota bacterium]
MLRKHVAIWCLLFSFSSLHAQIIDTVCAGFTNASYGVDNNMGSTYNWLVSGGTIVSGNGTNRITVNWKKEPGLFKIRVSERNAMGCLGDPQEGMVWLRGPIFGTSFPDQACLNDSVTIIASGGLNYLWSNGETDSTIRIKLITDTLLKVIISDTICGLWSDSFDVSIKAAIKPIMSITSDVRSVFRNQPVNIYYHGSSNDKLNWQIDKSNTSNPFGNGINIRFNDTGEAVIKVISVNPLGCIDSAFQKVEIRDEEIFFPTAFTPNGDGLNDLFKPQGLGVKEFRLSVFNRWGQTIFMTKDPDVGWDGTADGVPVQTDVYSYQCDMVGLSGKVYGYNGNVTVIR